MLAIEPVRTSDPASGDYTLINCVPASGKFNTLAMTYRGDVHFVPVLFSLSTISESETEDGEITGSDEFDLQILMVSDYDMISSEPCAFVGPSYECMVSVAPRIRVLGRDSGSKSCSRFSRKTEWPANPDSRLWKCKSVLKNRL
ncbi:hypothetical protein SLEP1_g34553 [Rubroshorea leprosula]|uniref:Uncharacterized protein n=1 Tax=Rubroshorea leprosula TaxID=152421 RepID=A0AAV5KKB0_9ROSI|nr:hypothetical protein SLEP1_g34553 [Rubroshorea leprosula]